MPIDIAIEGECAEITMALHETRNGLDEISCAQLIECVQACADQRDLRFLILRGLKDWFCIGGSGAYVERAMVADIERRTAFTIAVQEAIAALLQCGLLVVSVLDGLAAGAGVDLLLASDLVLAGETARMSLLYGKLGLVPDVGFRLLEWRLRSGDALRFYAESRVLGTQELVQLGLADALPKTVSDMSSLAQYLCRRFRHDADTFRAAKSLRNAMWWEAFEREMKDAARLQAEAFDREATRKRVSQSAAFQRAM